ncbi:MAG: tetratricopeptide repeat protein [bacterium]
MERGAAIFRQGLLCCLGAALLLAGCSSAEERSLSALHHFQRGNQAYRVEDFSGAIASYRRAIELDPEAADLHYNLGLAFYRAENFRLAALAFQQALRQRPGMADAHYNLALAYDKLFNSNAAHEHYNLYRALTAPAAVAGNTAAAVPGRIPASPAGAGGGARGSQTAPGVGLANKTTKSRARPRAGAARLTRGRGSAALSQQSNSQGSEKWWIQDRFTRNR